MNEKIVIPPNNADISIQKANKPFGERYNGYDVNATYNLNVSLPKNFSWHIVDSSDGKERKLIKERILKPSQQGKCGNCYEHSVADVLSDLFLITYGLKENPQISSAYINIHYSNLGGCKGGNPIDVLKATVNEGIVSNKCVDNSMCLTNSTCNGQDNGNVGTEKLNYLYSKTGDGCYVNEHKDHKLYFPKGESSDTVNYRVYPNYDKDFSDEIMQNTKDIKDFIQNGDSGLQSYPEKWKILVGDQNEVRKQIYRNGPAIGTLLVPSSFLAPFFKYEKFESVFDGLFFDSVVWDSSGNYTYQNPQLLNAGVPQPKGYSLQIDGGHAVCVIGYGVSEKSIPLMDFKSGKVVNVKNVPFWWVRNSWGSHWNPKYGGYVKIPVYPYNKVLQFDVPVGSKPINGKPISVPTPYTGARTGMGGMIFTQAGNIRDYENDKSNNYYSNHSNLSDSNNYIHYSDPDFYKTTSQDFLIIGGVQKDANGKISGHLITKGKNPDIIYIVIGIAALVILNIFLVRHYMQK